MHFIISWDRYGLLQEGLARKDKPAGLPPGPASTSVLFAPPSQQITSEDGNKKGWPSTEKLFCLRGGSYGLSIRKLTMSHTRYYLFNSTCITHTLLENIFWYQMRTVQISNSKPIILIESLSNLSQWTCLDNISHGHGSLFSPPKKDKNRKKPMHVTKKSTLASKFRADATRK